MAAAGAAIGGSDSALASTAGSTLATGGSTRAASDDGDDVAHAASPAPSNTPQASWRQALNAFQTTRAKERSLPMRISLLDDIGERNAGIRRVAAGKLVYEFR